MSRKVLILLAHPALERSRVNRALVDAVYDLDGITLHDLYEDYPDYDVDVNREQALLVEHDVVVMQHPFYWYSTPALLKEWQDLVLQHGWAYGAEGSALAGKTLVNALTAGGREETYRRGGHNHYTIREFLAPIERTAALCGMEYLPPFVVYGTHCLEARALERDASDYRRVVEALRDDAIDVDAVRDETRINARLDVVLRRPTET